jgi:hypothetical protein
MKRVPVQRAALLARVNRKLAKTDQKVLRSRSAAEKSTLGEWYVVGPKGIERTHVDLAALARELDSFAVWEIVAPYGRGGKVK